MEAVEWTTIAAGRWSAWTASVSFRAGRLLGQGWLVAAAKAMGVKAALQVRQGAVAKEE